MIQLMFHQKSLSGSSRWLYIHPHPQLKQSKTCCDVLRRLALPHYLLRACTIYMQPHFGQTRCRGTGLYKKRAHPKVWAHCYCAHWRISRTSKRFDEHCFYSDKTAQYHDAVSGWCTIIITTFTWPYKEQYCEWANGEGLGRNSDPDDAPSDASMLPEQVD